MKPTHFLWGFTPKANKLVLWCSFNIYQQGLRGNANQSIPDPLFWWRGENLYGVFHLMSTTAFSQLVLFCGVSDSLIIFQGTLPVEFLSNIPRSTNKQIHICKFQPKHKNSDLKFQEWGNLLFPDDMRDFLDWQKRLVGLEYAHNIICNNNIFMPFMSVFLCQS